MNPIYDRFNKLAHKLINKYGYDKATYLEVKSESEGWRNMTEFKSHKIKICILPQDKYSRETNRIYNEKNVLDTNYRAFMPVYDDFVPKINDRILAGSDEFTVLSIVKIAPSGKNIVYKLELK